MSDNLRLINTGKARTKSAEEFGDKLDALLEEYEDDVGFDAITVMLDLVVLARKLSYIEFCE